MSATSTDPRVRAARALAPVIARKGSLSTLQAHGLSSRDHRLFRALCYGVCRTLPRLERLSNLLLEKPFKARDLDVQALLLLGLYQLLYMRIPTHATVGETAGAARDLGKPWATNVLNACLRRAQRDQTALDATLSEERSVQTLHPKWLLTRLDAAWPADVERIVDANNTPAPMTLRVNLARGTRDDYLKRLQAIGLDATPCQHATAGIRLHTPVDVEVLPGFGTGDVSVQDEAAQLAAPLLFDALPTLDRPLRVLDACSAPGGKSAHLLELAAAEGRELALTALDSDDQRLTRVHETLTRLGASAQVIHGDASQTDWWDGTPFDAILLDAPCSGTGVIRRHPDIKVLRTSQDIEQLSALQRRILDTLWPMLATGGHMLYATCSILPDENAEQVQAFLDETPDARNVPLSVTWGIDQHGARQRLPGDDDADGFFYALLTH